MKFFLLLAFCICSINTFAQNNPVIVELFTSQGCSSCPAADKNLTEILAQSTKRGQPIFGLSFHVDYWNYIGWKDPYSSKEFTERQRKYAGQLNLRSIYTPQMIVNGHLEFVGSSKSESESVILEALKEQASYHVTIDEFQSSGGKITFRYELDTKPKSEVMNIAIVERSVENYVPRGENSGHTLRHDNVVKYFVTKPIKRTDNIELSLENLNIKKASVIVYVQDKDLHILGAGSHVIP